MEAFFTYYDWLYDAVFGTGDFVNGYLEGYDYDIVDGEVVYDTTKFDPPVTDPFMPGKSTVLKNSPVESVEMYLKLQAGEEPTTGAERTALSYFESAPAMAEGYVIAAEHQDELLTSLFNAAPTDTMKKKWEQLQTGSCRAWKTSHFLRAWKKQEGICGEERHLDGGAAGVRSRGFGT